MHVAMAILGGLLPDHSGGAGIESSERFVGCDSDPLRWLSHRNLLEEGNSRPIADIPRDLARQDASARLCWHWLHQESLFDIEIVLILHHAIQRQKQID